MASRPPNTILAGCVRWLDLLQRNTPGSAWTVLLASPRDAGLTPTQYQLSLKWLYEAQLLTGSGEFTRLSPAVRNLPPAELAIVVLATSLAADPPPWLRNDADLDADVPIDGREVSGALGLTSHQALEGIQRARRKVDSQLTKEIGDAGETQLLRLLEASWPHSATHVAADDDTAGYDIAFTHARHTWHLEVKATTRRGRLTIYLSRNEYEQSQVDPSWRLVVIGLDSQRQLAALATARTSALHRAAPLDQHEGTTWSSARYKLGPDDLLPDLWLDQPEPVLTAARHETTFAWLQG